MRRRGLRVGHEPVERRPREPPRLVEVEVDAGKRRVAPLAHLLVVVDPQHGDVVRDREARKAARARDLFGDLVVRREDAHGTRQTGEPRGEAGCEIVRHASPRRRLEHVEPPPVKRHQRLQLAPPLVAPPSPPQPANVGVVGEVQRKQLLRGERDGRLRVIEHAVPPDGPVLPRMPGEHHRHAAVAPLRQTVESRSARDDETVRTPEPHDLPELRGGPQRLDGLDAPAAPPRVLRQSRQPPPVRELLRTVHEYDSFHSAAYSTSFRRIAQFVKSFFRKWKTARMRDLLQYPRMKKWVTLAFLCLAFFFYMSDRQLFGLLVPLKK